MRQNEGASRSETSGVEIEITDVAFGGKGVARYDGKVFFVPFVIPGERIAARVQKQKKRFVEAAVVDVLEPSPDRVEPRCEYFGVCGGCAYQHIAYGRQLALKGSQVEQAIRRIGKLEHVPMRETVASPLEYEYRNRIRVHVDDRGRVGFFAYRSHHLVEIEYCPISSSPVNAALAEARQSRLPAGDYSLSARGRGEFFEQTNNAVAALMVEVVRDAIRPEQALIIDAYCGAGFFAHRLIDRAERVVGIEENVFAIEHARKRATDSERYLAGDVALYLGDLLGSASSEKTVVVLDPPAAGISPRVSDLLLGSPPAEIVYVSCDPGTLARDLGVLCRSTYRLQSVTPLDMFPQTAEIETVAHLVKV